MILRHALPVAAVALVGAAGAGQVRLNLTESAPMGLYATQPGSAAVRGSFVVTCLPESVGREGLARGYLQPGACPGGAEPVLKPVGAVEGDTVHVTQAGVFVNGAAVPNTAQLDQDSAGRALQPVPPGSYRVAPGEVWLLSSHSPLSWDARYWGPLPTDAVQATARPLLALP